MTVPFLDLVDTGLLFFVNFLLLVYKWTWDSTNLEFHKTLQWYLLFAFAPSKQSPSTNFFHERFNLLTFCRNTTVLPFMEVCDLERDAYSITIFVFIKWATQYWGVDFLRSPFPIDDMLWYHWSLVGRPRFFEITQQPFDCLNPCS